MEFNPKSIPAEDFDRARTALLNLPVPGVVTSAEDQYADFHAHVDIIGEVAPATAEHMTSLFGIYSDYSGAKIETVQAAFFHLQHMREFAERQALQADHSAQAAPVSRQAAYEAQLARFAHRRETIKQARMAVKQAIQDREAAVKKLEADWNLYIEHLRNEARRLEAIPAGQWEQGA